MFRRGKAVEVWHGEVRSVLASLGGYGVEGYFRHGLSWYGGSGGARCGRFGMAWWGVARQGGCGLMCCGQDRCVGAR